MLALGDLQPGDTAVSVAQQQLAGQTGCTSVQLNDVQPGKQHLRSQEIEFVIDQRNGLSWQCHGVASVRLQ